MIKKLNKIKPKKQEDPKVMCNKVYALNVKYWDGAKILDNDTIVTELMQAQVEAEVNNMEIMYKSLIRPMNVAWRIKSDRGVVQVGESEVALTNTEFKGKCHTCGKYGHKQNKCPERINQKKKKETRSLHASVITMVKQGIKM